MDFTARRGGIRTVHFSPRDDAARQQVANVLESERLADGRWPSHFLARSDSKASTPLSPLIAAVSFCPLRAAKSKPLEVPLWAPSSAR